MSQSEYRELVFCDPLLEESDSSLPLVECPRERGLYGFCAKQFDKDEVGLGCRHANNIIIQHISTFQQDCDLPSNRWQQFPRPIGKDNQPDMTTLVTRHKVYGDIFVTISSGRIIVAEDIA